MKLEAVPRDGNDPEGGGRVTMSLIDDKHPLNNVFREKQESLEPFIPLPIVPKTFLRNLLLALVLKLDVILDVYSIMHLLLADVHVVCNPWKTQSVD